MTQHISRFIDSPDEQTQESFARLFGSRSFKEHLVGLSRQQREQACVEEYMKIVQSAGSFAYASHAVVLHPLKDRTHFHLIYLTRNAKGIEVFKDAEKKSMPEMDSVRAKAQQDDRKKRTGQREMFASDEMIDSSYIESLRSGYGQRARTEILSSLKDSGRMTYDDAWRMALRLPLVTDADLKRWIKDWRSEGVIRLEGLRPTERVPKLGANHSLIVE